jgi:hypothetical protein
MKNQLTYVLFVSELSEKIYHAVECTRFVYGVYPQITLGDKLSFKLMLKTMRNKDIVIVRY